MNKLLAASKDRHAHPPEPDPVEKPRPAAARRVGVIDRLALHLGVALITWSRRPHRARLIASAELLAAHQLRDERLAHARARAEQNYPRFIIR
ncbi:MULTISPECIES: hypothetical protein [unclassified Salinibacterium]|uniref:hypothetical protein n=1 Tax=unclassified Salinibacterium TaxID=2632331 RepID=UPI0018CE7113|nr:MULTISPECIES: hypothetical protein [unclassified Salinibacterium]MBH0053723.1 hypothetical protein [Salinibacterium sp. SWN139]MBH0082989.1 hypothetical protein [Salinibacterium sp. SWN167]